MVPHAGYLYSGGCAGKGFARAELTPTVVILGVNHRGRGHPFAVDGHDSWQTPLGLVQIDGTLRDRLVASAPMFTIDSEAGLSEHSLEVQVPFIQYLRPDARILPVVVASHQLEELLAAGTALGKLLASEAGLMIVASTDMSHYIAADEARRLDHQALERVLHLDGVGLFQVVSRLGISMCGVAPTTMMLVAAAEAGARKAELVAYTNSGEATGDPHEVVAYASALVY